MQPLAAGDDRDLPAADRQRGPDRAGRGDACGGRAHISFRLRKLFGLDEWRPRRSAEQVLADIHDWIAADEERIAEAFNIDAPVGGRE